MEIKVSTFKGLDKDIIKMNDDARVFCEAFNNSKYASKEERFSLLKANLGEIGEDSLILQPFHCDSGKNIFIGKHSFINYDCIILDMSKVTIGDNVLIGPRVTISTAEHSLVASERRNRDGVAKDIIIEDDVWIGASATIIGGVRLAKGTVIAAGAVVTKSTEPNSVYGGVPAKKIKDI